MPAFPGDARGRPVGVRVGDRLLRGFDTPSRKLEFYSPTLAAWGWPEYALPTYIRSHVHRSGSRCHPGRVRPDPHLPPADPDPHPLRQRQMAERDQPQEPPLAPSHRCRPAGRGHQRLGEGEHRHRLLRGALLADRGHPTRRGGLLAITWAAGACRRRAPAAGARPWWRWIAWRTAAGPWPQQQGIQPWASADPDSQRVWWQDVGVHQNLTFPVHPDPISGMHCWHQKVRLEKAGPADRYGDIVVDTGAVARHLPRVVGHDPARRPGLTGRHAAAVLAPARLPADARRLPTARLIRFDTVPPGTGAMKRWPHVLAALWCEPTPSTHVVSTRNGGAKARRMAAGADGGVCYNRAVMLDRDTVEPIPGWHCSPRPTGDGQCASPSAPFNWR